MITPLETLQKYWQYNSFRSPQEDIIQTINLSQDVIALLPTGSGKSICFQVPTLQHEKGVCLVISPLVALMNDQVKQLEQRNVRAIALTGLIPVNEMVRMMDNIKYSNIRFVYISPERLASEFFIDKLKELPIKWIAIDEAHCISEWGHDFRPSYLQIYKIRTYFPEVPLMAMTATATDKVVQDIVRYLNLKTPKIYKKSLVRENLKFQVLHTQDKLGVLFQKLKGISESAIVYVGSRKMGEHTSRFLNHKGLKSTYYHAGLTDSQKELAYKNWFQELTPIMVATNAFGMGIDKPNVRTVVHMSVPSSVENYIQEAGRAGRDGVLSDAIIIEEPADFLSAESIFFGNLPDETFIKNVYDSLNQYFRILYGELPDKLFMYDLNDFCQQFNLPVLKTFYSLEILEREGILMVNKVKDNVHSISFNISSEALFAYYENNPFKEKILKHLLRTYEGLFDRMVVINPILIAKKFEISVDKMLLEFNQLKNDGVIHYQATKHTNSLKFLVPREDHYTMNRIMRDIRKQLDSKKEKYKLMLDYISDTSLCRNIQIAQYFDEKRVEPCGICDNCLAQNKEKVNINALKKNIVLLLKAEETMSSKEMITLLGVDATLALEVIKDLLKEEVITIDNYLKIRLK